METFLGGLVESGVSEMTFPEFLGKILQNSEGRFYRILKTQMSHKILKTQHFEYIHV